MRCLNARSRKNEEAGQGETYIIFNQRRVSYTYLHKNNFYQGGLGMTQEHHHEELVKGITAEQKPILDKSGQAIYIYLDDAHKVCNKKFATLLGYRSVKEWVDTEAPLADVIEKDQPKVIDAYTRASENLEPTGRHVTPNT